MAKSIVGVGLLTLLVGPASCLVALGVLLNPAAQGSCVPTSSASLSIGQIPAELTAQTTDGTTVTLDHTQLTHAATIVSIGSRANGVGRDGVTIALMAGLTESWLRMLSNTRAYPESGTHPNDGNGNDGDSLGIFQMRPSAGWGTVTDLMDPAYQARAFFGGPTGPNRGSPPGLLDLPNWQEMPKGDAAQAVEGSAFPGRYATTEPVAVAILDALMAAPPAPARPGPGNGRERPGQAGTGRILGQMPSIDAVPGGPVTGRIRTANANLKYPRSTPVALRIIRSAATPDFITLNEIHRFSSPALERALPGYGAYKDPVVIRAGNAAQSINNAIMWRRDTWRLVDGGRVKIVEDDHAIFEGKPVLWDRYATWGIFERRADAAVVAVVSTHHMTNVRKFSRQWGDPPLSRREQYDLGMDILIQLAGVLSRYGPVLVGGDMNSHSGDGPFAAVPRMQAARFDYTKDQGVMYQFFPRQVTVEDHRQLAVPSDHPANLTTLSMNGTGPGATRVTGPGGCAPCPGLGVLPGSGKPGPSPPDSYNLGPVSPALRRLVEILAPIFGIQSVGGYRESARDPDGHPSGNAADFMVPSDATGWATPEGKRMGDALAAYAQAQAAELRVDYIIWWQQIWSVERADEGWRPMESRGTHNEDHRNHVHINVVAGMPGDAAVNACDTSEAT